LINATIDSVLVYFNTGKYLSMNNDPVVIVPYDPGWTDIFKNEAELLQTVIPLSNIVIEHIGSTSVAGLAAKPIIDIMVGFESLDDATIPFQRLRRWIIDISPNMKLTSLTGAIFINRLARRATFICTARRSTVISGSNRLPFVITCAPTRKPVLTTGSLKKAWLNNTTTTAQLTRMLKPVSLSAF
jgi:hypothetical protein